MKDMAPVKTSERHIILDALRGFALLGICLANFPEFSLYTFQKPEVVAAMPTAGIDKIVRFLQYLFVDGKFYTIFSLLFGIGFSIIIDHAAQKGADGFRIFYRRMVVLAAIGFLHLMFIWSGDILLLYALLGMLLPLFRHASDKVLLGTSAVLLLLPILVDGLSAIFGVSLSAPAVQMQWHYCDLYGITEDNFGIWLRDAESYEAVFHFLIQGACVRLQEFIDGNRYFKVFGLFLLGFYIGRKQIYANLEANRTLLTKMIAYGFLLGLPLSLLYAWSSATGHPFGTVAHTAIYTVSVYPLGAAYISALCLLYLRRKEWRLWHHLAAPGRMALTNYIGQSVCGMLLFYGIGFGLGASAGLIDTELIAAAIFLLQMVFSLLWLSCFRFGPIEWFWRMLTYRKILPLKNKKEQQ